MTAHSRQAAWHYDLSLNHVFNWHAVSRVSSVSHSLCESGVWELDYHISRRIPAMSCMGSWLQSTEL